MKHWRILHSRDQPESATPTAEDILSSILANRGITTDAARQAFLSPVLSSLTFDAVGIRAYQAEKAVGRIQKAIAGKESVVVYTDYDVDGVCGGTLVWEALHALGARVMPYIPHREKEGYGLSKDGLDRVHRELGPTLLITVDHGVSAAAYVAYAQTLGMETIIIDHHVLPETLPEAVALVHTTELAAAGIAWLFTRFLLKSLGKKREGEEYADIELAAIATIADLMPLTGSNRTLAWFGLSRLSETTRLGLRALLKEAGVTPDRIDSYTVSHILAPRINASGRLSHALDALRLLCTRDKARAAALAGALGAVNRERQLLTETSFAKAKEKIAQKGKQREKLLFVSDPEFKPGIIGLIAGKLTQEFFRPSVVVAEGETYAKASARSVRGVDIVAMLRKAEHLLSSVGGHPMAAGFTVAMEKLPDLRRALVVLSDAEIPDELLTPTLTADMEIPLAAADVRLSDLLRQLAPFGMGNREPVFVTGNVRILTAATVGREKNHLKLLLASPATPSGKIAAIGFGMGNIFDTLRPDCGIDVAYSIEKNTWNGDTQLQLKLRDVRVAAQR